MQTGLLGVAPIVRDGHHHRLTQRFMQLLRRCLPQRYVVGKFQLRLRKLYDIQAI